MTVDYDGWYIPPYCRWSLNARDFQLHKVPIFDTFSTCLQYILIKIHIMLIITMQTVHKYRISSYKTRGIILIVFYSKVAVHKCAGIIRVRSIYEEIRWQYLFIAKLPTTALQFRASLLAVNLHPKPAEQLMQQGRRSWWAIWQVGRQFWQEQRYRKSHNSQYQISHLLCAHPLSDCFLRPLMTCNRLI